MDIDLDATNFAKIEPHNLRHYFPEKKNWIVFCHDGDQDEFYLGIEAWLQFLFDHQNATYVPPRPLFGFNEEQSRWRYWSLLSSSFNKGRFRVKFVEVDE